MGIIDWLGSAAKGLWNFGKNAFTGVKKVLSPFASSSAFYNAADNVLRAGMTHGGAIGTASALADAALAAHQLRNPGRRLHNPGSIFNTG